MPKMKKKNQTKPQNPTKMHREWFCKSEMTLVLYQHFTRSSSVSEDYCFKLNGKGKLAITRIAIVSVISQSWFVEIPITMQHDYGFHVNIWRLYRVLAKSLPTFHGEKLGIEHLNALVLVLLKIRMAATISPPQLPSPAVRTAQLLM